MAIARKRGEKEDKRAISRSDAERHRPRQSAVEAVAPRPCGEHLRGRIRRPVFLWGRDGDGLYKGSCRTVDGDSVHLVELMTRSARDTFTQFGGHTGAGGFTVNKETIFNLEEILNTAYDKLKDTRNDESNKERATRVLSME